MSQTTKEALEEYLSIGLLRGVRACGTNPQLDEPWRKESEETVVVHCIGIGNRWNEGALGPYGWAQDGRTARVCIRRCSRRGTLLEGRGLRRTRANRFSAVAGRQAKWIIAKHSSTFWGISRLSKDASSHKLPKSTLVPSQVPSRLRSSRRMTGSGVKCKKCRLIYEPRRVSTSGIGVVARAKRLRRSMPEVPLAKGWKQTLHGCDSSLYPSYFAESTWPLDKPAASECISQRGATDPQ